MVFSSFPEQIDESAILNLASKAADHHVTNANSSGNTAIHHLHIDDGENETASLLTNDLLSFDPSHKYTGGGIGSIGGIGGGHNQLNALHSANVNGMGIGSRSITSEGKRSRG